MIPAVAVHDVSVAFGGLRALETVSVDIPEDSIVGIIGPNGAGKTTLFNVISGLQAPTTGRVMLGGSDVTRLDAHERSHLGLGRSFQNLGLMVEQTVETNLLAALSKEAGYGLLDPVFRPWRWARREEQLRGKVDEGLMKFDLVAWRHEEVGNLSFGVARFVELAAVMMSDPAIVLLDEPTTGLDPGETRRLLELLQDLRLHGTTIVLVAHNVSFVMEICDEVHVLARGSLISSGSPGEVQHDPQVIAAYLGEAGH